MSGCSLGSWSSMLGLSPSLTALGVSGAAGLYLCLRYFYAANPPLTWAAQPEARPVRLHCFDSGHMHAALSLSGTASRVCTRGRLGATRSSSGAALFGDGAPHVHFTLPKRPGGYGSPRLLVLPPRPPLAGPTRSPPQQQHQHPSRSPLPPAGQRTRRTMSPTTWTSRTSSWTRSACPSSTTRYCYARPAR